MQITRKHADYTINFKLVDCAHSPVWDIDIYPPGQTDYAIGSFGDIGCFEDALLRGVAFICGHIEGKKAASPSQEVQSLNRILKTMAEETARICKMTTSQE